MTRKTQIKKFAGATLLLLTLYLIFLIPGIEQAHKVNATNPTLYAMGFSTAVLLALSWSSALNELAVARKVVVLMRAMLAHYDTGAWRADAEDVLAEYDAIRGTDGR